MLNSSLLINQLPGFVFYKTLTSDYLTCNHAMSDLVGLRHPEAIEGLTDIAIFKDDALAQRYLQDDAMVVRQGKLTVLEPTQNKAGESIRVLTTKSVFFNEQGDPAGIAAQAIIVPNFCTKDNTRKTIVNQYQNLTRKESEVVYYLMRHYTSKDIAKILNRSHRTIEKHIENIKLKWGVSSKREMIDYGIINYADILLSISDERLF